MFTRIQHELKLQPLFIYGLLFISFFVVLSVHDYRVQTQSMWPKITKTMRVSAPETVSNPTDYKNEVISIQNRIDAVTAILNQAQSIGVVAPSSYRLTSNDHTEDQQWRTTIAKLSSAFRAHHFRQANQLLATAIQRHPRFIKRGLLSFFDGRLQQGDTPTLINELHVFVRTRINKTPYINEFADVLPQTLYQLVTVTRPSGSSVTDISIFPYLLSIIIICAGLIYTRERRQNTLNFQLVTPKPLLFDTCAKAFWPLIFINLVIWGSVALSTLTVALLTGLPLGDLAMPILTLSINSSAITSLLSVLLHWLLLVNLWAGVIITLTAFLGEFIHNATTLMFYTTVFTFLEPLKLLQLIPPSVRIFIPANYSSSFLITTARDDFAIHGLNFMLLVFPIWMLVFGALTTSIQIAKYRGTFQHQRAHLSKLLIDNRP